MSGSALTRGLLPKLASGRTAPSRLAGSCSPQLNRAPAGQAQPSPPCVLGRSSSSSSSREAEEASQPVGAPLQQLDSAALAGTSALGLAAAAGALLTFPEPAAALSLDQLLGSVEDAVASAGTAGPAIFIAAYVLATVLLVPGSVLTLAAGALFGPLLGTAVVSVASTLGASAAFLVGRYLARPAVERWVSTNRKFSAVDSAIASQGARIVLLLRLSPLFPFTLLNYGLSLTSVGFWPYLGASWMGMLPGTVAYVALGGAGRAAAETASGGGMDPLRLGLYVVGAVATLWATKIISQTASAALKEASEEISEEEKAGL